MTSYELGNVASNLGCISVRFASTLVIAASIIAAVRLARDQDISRPSPRLVSVITDSIALARMILEKIVR